MSAYRFCRTDDIGLLVDALNHCWAPHFPGQPLETVASFKRSIRDLQVWCSSCMVAFAGAEPIAVLIGAKRASATLIHRIAVHPDHTRQGHGRHLLDSLGSKLAILGPPRLVAEVPEALEAASALFSACGYVREGELTDYILEPQERAGGHAGLVIPISVDDLAANGLLGEDYPSTCWDRAVETLTARKNEVDGLAVASDERIEAYLLYKDDEILSLRSFVADGGARLKQLLAQHPSRRRYPLRFQKVHPAEIPPGLLETLGFCRANGHLLCTARPGASSTLKF